MPHVGTTLTPSERCCLGALLYHLAVQRIARSKAEGLEAEADAREAIHGALGGQPSISRLRQVAKTGRPFPTPVMIKRLADALNCDWLELLRLSGYERDLIEAIHLLYVSARTSNPEAQKRAKYWSINYAVRMFPLRGETYLEIASLSSYSTALLTNFIRGTIDELAFSKQKDGCDELIATADRRATLPIPLSIASKTLGLQELNVDARRAVAGELVRAWALSADETVTREAVSKTYAGRPTVGGVVPVPLPNGPFALRSTQK